MGKTFWGVVSAAVEQSRRLLRETGNSALEADPRIPPNQKKIPLFVSPPRLAGYSQTNVTAPSLDKSESDLAKALFRAVFICLQNAVKISIPKPGVEAQKMELLSMEEFPTAELGIGIYPGYGGAVLKKVSHSTEDKDAFRFFQVNLQLTLVYTETSAFGRIYLEDIEDMTGSIKD